jgi:hypothetical protein
VLLAVIVNEYAAAVVGVPVTAPVEVFSEIPAGNEPEETEYDPL